MSVAEEGLQLLRMSWDDYLLLPEKPKAEWVDGEVVVSPPVSYEHGDAVISLAVALRTTLTGLRVVTEVGVWLPRNRLRAPDLMVVQRRPEGRWVTDPPVLVVEVLSPSTRSEDTMRKSGDYLSAGISQYWVVDPDARAIDVFEAVDGAWERVLRLDDAAPSGDVVVGGHGTVPLSLDEVFSV
ncbi:Uma2 family endonuclease [Nocardioides rubriscoriae]|uniref:Uma2 family endonuclease n=1 Tax=Nocardioides rubriscoriae TaxID=642762 RepID=UPI0011DF6AF6|nr:Uma2 family endonuclease [Nocardioides rubriscoriae]